MSVRRRVFALLLAVVTAVAERVMKQPITFNVTCSKCGHKIEIAILGTEIFVFGSKRKFQLKIALKISVKGLFLKVLLFFRS